MKIYDTRTKSIEEFTPLQANRVTMYSCGPTVYGYYTIGNLRTAILVDTLKRVLLFDKYHVDHITNITDVGHLVNDADAGKDKLEEKATKEGKTAWEIADFYTKAFLHDIEEMNIIPSDKYPKASEHIKEQIALIEKLIEDGYAYVTSTAVYFDVTKFSSYGALSGQQLEDKMVHVRQEVITDPTKRHPFDFRLWQLDQPNHQMQWDSPWGKGFPGWHIECSAMAMKYLGETLDFHLGGIDLITPHHENEIAQSESATGKEFVRYWVHGEFITINGERMGKSKGNAYTLTDIKAKGYDPLALRYLYLTSHYRSRLNFTWDALKAANIALDKIREIYLAYRSAEKDHLNTKEGRDYLQEFSQTVNNDLGMPQAVSLLWEVIKDDTLSGSTKYELMNKMDTVFGLRLVKYTVPQLPERIQKLVEQRREARIQKLWKESDQIRDQLALEGYIIEDTDEGQKVIKRGYS